MANKDILKSRADIKNTQYGPCRVLRQQLFLLCIISYKKFNIPISLSKRHIKDVGIVAEKNIIFYHFVSYSFILIELNHFSWILTTFNSRPFFTFSFSTFRITMIISVFMWMTWKKQKNHFGKWFNFFIQSDFTTPLLLYFFVFLG